MKYFSHYRAYVPTLLTLLHLINGVVLLHTVQTIGTQYIVIQLLFSIVLDGLDGYLAKRWGVTSELGAMLDSLADFLTFIIVPVTLMGLPVGIVFAGAGAWRLAYFHILGPKSYFVGLPTTIAGPLALVVLILSPHHIVSTIFVALLGLAMVLPVKIPRVLR